MQNAWAWHFWFYVRHCGVNLWGLVIIYLSAPAPDHVRHSALVVPVSAHTCSPFFASLSVSRNGPRWLFWGSQLRRPAWVHWHVWHRGVSCREVHERKCAEAPCLTSVLVIHRTTASGEKDILIHICSVLIYVPQFLLMCQGIHGLDFKNHHRSIAVAFPSSAAQAWAVAIQFEAQQVPNQTQYGPLQLSAAALHFCDREGGGAAVPATSHCWARVALWWRCLGYSACIQQRFF